MSDLTLGDAADYFAWFREEGPVACACIGGPYCCAERHWRFVALQRGAHIAVKQIAEYAARRAGGDR